MNSIMRISLVLAREDNPRLYDELIQFPKGQRRVNRLRTLAYDGFLAQQPAAIQRIGIPDGTADRTSDGIAPRERVQASLELFFDPLPE